MEWVLKRGADVVRKELHVQYGGSNYSGIAMSARSPNVLIFTDPTTGERHGYFDGWKSDGLFHYTGEGQRGDQELSRPGNAAILNHKRQERSLRLFQGAGGTVRYVGEFEVDQEKPYYMAEAPETNGGPVRSVIVFRLRPLDAPAPTVTTPSPLQNTHQIEVLPLESALAQTALVEPSGNSYEAERRESQLVTRFRDYMAALGHSVVRQRILPAGEACAIFTDVFVPGRNLLVEAKGTTARNAVRMAVGQLLDYKRFFDSPTCAVLLPSAPREDLCRYVTGAGITVMWRDREKFLQRESYDGPPSELR